MRSTPVSAMPRKVIETDVAGCLKDRAAGADRYRLAHLAQAHVVEQNHLGAGGKRLMQLIDSLDFDLNELAEAFVAVATCFAAAMAAAMLPAARICSP